MRVVAITGRARHGKDTIASVLSEQLKEDRYRVGIFSFARPLKEISARELGISLELLEQAKNAGIEVNGINVRRYLQTRADKLKENDPEYFSKIVRDKIRESNTDVAIITDLRFLMEVSFLAREFRPNLDIVKVVRPSIQIKDSEHPSEYEVDYINPTYLIRNDKSLEDFKNKILDVEMEIVAKLK